jgi:hypothetical protein
MAPEVSSKSKEAITLLIHSLTYSNLHPHLLCARNRKALIQPPTSCSEFTSIIGKILAQCSHLSSRFPSHDYPTDSFNSMRHHHPTVCLPHPPSSYFPCLREKEPSFPKSETQGACLALLFL